MVLTNEGRSLLPTILQPLSSCYVCQFSVINEPYFELPCDEKGLLSDVFKTKTQQQSGKSSRDVLMDWFLFWSIDTSLSTKVLSDFSARNRNRNSLLPIPNNTSFTHTSHCVRFAWTKPSTMTNMIKDIFDKQVLELKKLWANKRQLLFQLLNLAMIVFSALMIWKALMCYTKVREIQSWRAFSYSRLLFSVNNSTLSSILGVFFGYRILTPNLSLSKPFFAFFRIDESTARIGTISNFHKLTAHLRITRQPTPFDTEPNALAHPFHHLFVLCLSEWIASRCRLVGIDGTGLSARRHFVPQQ